MLLSEKYIIITSIIEYSIENSVKNNSFLSYSVFLNGFQLHLDIHNVSVGQVSLFPSAAK